MHFTHTSAQSRARSGRSAQVALLLLLLSPAWLWPSPSQAQSSTTPTIHVPYFAGNPDPAQGAIFWFGALDAASNSANVRMSYADGSLVVVLHIFDRRTIYDQADSAGRDLTQWDAVSLYLDTQGSLTAPLASGSYRFDAQLNHWQGRANYQRAYRWQAGGWQVADLTLATTTTFRGTPNDLLDDRGWIARFQLPFASLGLAAAPDTATAWRMALVLHDRDDATGAPLPVQRWPAQAALDQPATWGRVAFGAPVYAPPTVTGVQTLSLRHGVNQVVAPDAAVGGHSLCGAQFNPNFFAGWGEANYAGLTQINIQNQWDIADWPCFSRYYVTFPLTALPDAAKVVSATLTMQMFGNAGYQAGDAKPSTIQIARVAADWNERTLTWNNAPPVLENSSWAVVNPMQAGDPPAKKVVFDVTRAVADASAVGQPLRLALYSTDGDYHSGKYFWSADAGENLRPSLLITWGNSTDDGGDNRGVYTLAAAPSQLVITGDKTAHAELTITGLNPGETVTLSTGPSSPAGLEVVLAPKTIAAPGGKAILTIIGRTDQASQQPTLYTVPISATNSKSVQTASIAVLINGRQLFLPVIAR